MWVVFEDALGWPTPCILFRTGLYKATKTTNNQMNPLQEAREIWNPQTDFTQASTIWDKNPKTETKEMLHVWTRGQKKKIMRDIKNLPDNRILLGYTDKGCEGSPVTIPIFTYSKDKPQSTKILISGKSAGSGKTVLGLSIAWLYAIHLNYNVIIFDAKPEAQTRKIAQDDPRLKELLYKVHEQFPIIRPQGWPMLSVKPAFSDRNEPFTGIEVKYDLNQLNFQDIITLFGLNPRSKEDYIMIDKLDMLVHGRMEITNIGEERGSDEDDILTCRQVGKLISEGDFKVDKFLVRRFKNLFDNKVIGRGSDFDITQFLNEGRTVQYQTRLVENKNPIPETLAYVSCEIRNIYRGRYAIRNPNEDPKVKRIRRPVAIYANEMQTLYPRDPLCPSSKTEISNLLNTGRTYGLDLIADSTSLTEVHQILLKQSDYILTFRLDGTNGEYLRKVRNIDYAQMDQIYQLEEDKDNPPFQCAIIPPNLQPTDFLKTFFPLPPTGSLRVNE